MDCPVDIILMATTKLQLTQRVLYNWRLHKYCTSVS